MPISHNGHIATCVVVTRTLGLSGPSIAAYLRAFHAVVPHHFVTSKLANITDAPALSLDFFQFRPGKIIWQILGKFSFILSIQCCAVGTRCFRIWAKFRLIMPIIYCHSLGKARKLRNESSEPPKLAEPPQSNPACKQKSRVNRSKSMIHVSGQNLMD